MRRSRGGRLTRLRQRVRTAVEASFDDDQPPEEIAGSFAIGVFLTTLPTLGGNLLVMVALAARVAWINPVALFSSGIVVNPLVKWGVYAVSVPIGVALLGPIDGGLSVDLSLSGNRPLLVRVAVGSSIIAALAGLLSYGLVRQMVIAYRRREIDVVEELVDTVLTGDDEPTAPAEDAK
ncbi:DUF2062 domain-containing protein [Halonotius sp. GCM10025705]|uniref:DUF2062 domain-containing protein n=1 Tax=Halonotius sp. GCM10025705 TaxID=3252678 RepID=UPI0036128CFF